MEKWLIDQVDSLVQQLLLGPFISVPAGVIVYLIFRRIWAASILSLIVQALLLLSFNPDIHTPYRLQKNLVPSPKIERVVY